MKILVVDDNQKDRLLLIKIFESNGFEVSEACNGIEALESIEESKPDLIVSDIFMPKMDGFTFLHELKQYDKFKDIPFVYYTAQYLNKKDEEFADSLGVSKFIIKPKEAKELIDEIESVMAEHAADRPKVGKPLIETDEEYLKQYSNRVVQKLEEKYYDLEKSEKKYRTIIEHSNDMIWSLDTRGNVTFFNKRSEDLTGYKLDDWIGKSLAPLIHEKDLQKVQNVFKETMAGRLQHYEVTITKKDGSDMILSVNTTPMFESGEVVGTISFGKDVTEAKQTEKALRESEVQYRTLFEGSPDAIFLADPESGKIIDANKAASKLLQKSIDEIIGLHQTQLHPPRIYDYSLSTFEEHAGKSEISRFETIILRSDGGEVPVEVSAEPITIKGKTVLQGIFRDITERKTAEKELKETTELLQSVMDNATDEAIITTDRMGTILIWNEGAKRLLGYESEEVVGRESIRIFHTEEYLKSGIMDVNIKNMIATGKPLTLELEYITKNGKMIPVQTIVSPRFDKDGKFMGTVGMARDITERNHAEETLKLNNLRMDALLDINRMTKAPFSDIADFVLEKISLVTKSEYGFIGLMNEDESAFTIHSWANVMDICTVDGKPIEFPIEPAGIWGDVVRERKSIIVNDYSDPQIHKLGLPEGHVPISCVMVIPTFEDDKIVAIAAVANKKTNYDDSDIRQITLFMDGMWKHVQRQRAEEKLKKAATEWSLTFDSITDPVSIQDRDFKLVRVNKAFGNAVNANPDDLIGKFCYEVVHGTDECIPDCPHKQTLETKQPAIIEVFESRLGKYIEVSTSPIFDEDNEVIGSVHAIKDITERKVVEEEKRNCLVEKTRTQLQNFVVSALPVFASGVPPQTRNMLVSKFAQNFEDNVMLQFKQEMDDLNEDVAVQGAESTVQTKNLPHYLSWLEHFYANLGAQPNIASDGLSGYIEFSKCHWSNSSDINPVFCLICRAMVMRSFSWTNLKGRVNHSNSIADGSNKCRFDIILLPSTDVINSSNKGEL